MGVDRAAAARLLPGRQHAGADPAVQRLAVDLEQPGDAADGGTRPGQPHRLGKLRLSPARAGCRGLRCRRRVPLGGGIGQGSGADLPHVRGDVPRSGMVAFNGLVHGVAKVAQHVPPVGDLNGIRRTVASPFSVDAGAIAGDDLHPGTVSQPGRERPGVSIGQQVHQDRPVAMAAAPSPVVDAQHARGHRRCCIPAGLACGPEQRIRADGDRQSLGEPRACLTAHGQADAAVQHADALRPTGMKLCHVTQPLGEGPTRAVRKDAAEAPGPEPQRDGTTLPG